MASPLAPPSGGIASELGWIPVERSFTTYTEGLSETVSLSEAIGGQMTANVAAAATESGPLGETIGAAAGFGAALAEAVSLLEALGASGTATVPLAVFDWPYYLEAIAGAAERIVAIQETIAALEAIGSAAAFDAELEEDEGEILEGLGGASGFGGDVAEGWGAITEEVLSGQAYLEGLSEAMALAEAVAGMIILPPPLWPLHASIRPVRGPTAAITSSGEAEARLSPEALPSARMRDDGTPSATLQTIEPRGKLDP